VSCQPHAPAALPPGKEPPVRIQWEAGWTPEPVWMLWRRVKSFLCWESNPGRPALRPSLFENVCMLNMNIATGYGLVDRGVGVRVPVGSRIYPSPCRADLLRGPPSLLASEYGGVKRPGHEAYRSTNVEVKKTWVQISTPAYAFMA
jgi:hypothetical protein